MHNDFDAVGEEEVVICFYRNLDLGENLLLEKDKWHNCKMAYYYFGCIMPVLVFDEDALTWISRVVGRC